jgi:hypothetical protein
MANKASIAAETNTPRKAVARRSNVVIPAVKPRNMGALPIGSMVTKSVINAFNTTPKLGTVRGFHTEFSGAGVYQADTSKSPIDVDYVFQHY